MKQKEQHITFTAADIERYHAGALSMQERHALEKAALDDPFLADAIEGYANTSTPQADLIELQNRLAEKETARKRGLYIPFYQKPWLRVAALFLVLAGAGWTLYQLSFVQKEELAVTNESNQTQLDTVTNTDQLNKQTDSTIQNQRTEQDASTTASANAPKVRQAPVQTQLDNVNTEPVNTASSPVASVEAFNETENKDVIARQGARETRVKIAGNSPNQQTLNTFKGQIVDPNGNPIPNANIAINGQQKGAITNTMGQFFLTTPDSVVNATVAAVGFQPNRINLSNPGQEQKVILNQASGNLQEVVVTGYGKKRARVTTRPSATTMKAEREGIEPEGGWIKFNEYIAQNKRIPEEVTNEQRKGEVQLSFEVNKKGKPVNIKVVKSLCTACDLEAVRLLKAGPDWEKKREGQVTIRF